MSQIDDLYNSGLLTDEQYQNLKQKEGGQLPNMAPQANPMPVNPNMGQPIPPAQPDAQPLAQGPQTSTFTPDMAAGWSSDYNNPNPKKEESYNYNFNADDVEKLGVSSQTDSPPINNIPASLNKQLSTSLKAGQPINNTTTTTNKTQTIKEAKRSEALREQTKSLAQFDPELAKQQKEKLGVSTVESPPRNLVVADTSAAEAANQGPPVPRGRGQGQSRLSQYKQDRTGLIEGQANYLYGGEEESQKQYKEASEYAAGEMMRLDKMLMSGEINQDQYQAYKNQITSQMPEDTRNYFQKKEDYVRNVGEIDQMLSQDVALTHQDISKQLKSVNKDIKQKEKNRLASEKQSIMNLEDWKLDPQRYLNSRDSGRKILDAIGIIFGGLGGGLQGGGKNPAVDILMKRINDDNAAQMANQKNKFSAFYQLKKLHGDERLAELQSKKFLVEQSQRLMQQKMLNMKPGIAREELQNTLAELEKEKQSIKYTIDEQLLNTKYMDLLGAKSGSGGGKKKDKASAYGKALEKAKIPQTLGALDDVSNRLRTIDQNIDLTPIEQRNLFTRGLAGLQNFFGGSKTWTRAQGRQYEQAMASFNQTKNAVRHAMFGSQLTEHEIKAFEASIASASTPQELDGVVQQIRRVNESKAEAMAATYPDEDVAQYMNKKQRNEQFTRKQAPPQPKQR